MREEKEGLERGRKKKGWKGEEKRRVGKGKKKEAAKIRKNGETSGVKEERKEERNDSLLENH